MGTDYAMGYNWVKHRPRRNLSDIQKQQHQVDKAEKKQKKKTTTDDIPKEMVINEVVDTTPPKSEPPAAKEEEHSRNHPKQSKSEESKSELVAVVNTEEDVQKLQDFAQSDAEIERIMKGLAFTIQQ